MRELKNSTALKLTIGLSLVLTAFSGCSPQKHTATTPSTSSVVTSVPKAEVEAIYQEATQVLFSRRSLSATMFGVDESVAGQYYADQLEDFSPQSEAELRSKLSRILSKLELVNTLNGNEFDHTNKKVMENLIRYYAGEPTFNIGYIDMWMGHSPFVVNQINGPLIDTPNIIANNHPINSLRDANDYLKRLAGFNEFIDRLIQKLDHDVAQGWIPPKVLIKKTLNFVNGFVAGSAAEHSLVTSFSEKLNGLITLNEKQKQGLIKQSIQVVDDVVLPSYILMKNRLILLMDKGREESGIWAQPRGDEFYLDAIKQLGDSTLTPEQVHQLGLEEVKRISLEMDAILQDEGYKIGSVGKRMQKLNDEPRFLYPDSVEGRAQLLSDLNGMIAEITEKMKSSFATTPPYRVEVRRIPIERQDSAPGGQYTSPTLDGSQPGIYWINLKDMESNPKFDLKSLTYHEANPGHHWQIALNMAQDKLPLLRRIAPYNAYTEGWALYSEQIGYEMGMYENDPFGNLGRLKAELFRSVRLVVDTGLHYKKWTREEAIAYMAATTGTSESSVVSEIERYMAWPGQALGYKLGMINMIKLRANAKKKLGKSFNIKKFHDLVLLGGAVPMSVLEQKVEDWIVEQKGTQM